MFHFSSCFLQLWVVLFLAIISPCWCIPWDLQYLSAGLCVCLWILCLNHCGWSCLLPALQQCQGCPPVRAVWPSSSGVGWGEFLSGLKFWGSRSHRHPIVVLRLTALVLAPCGKKGVLRFDSTGTSTVGIRQGWYSWGSIPLPFMQQGLALLGQVDWHTSGVQASTSSLRHEWGGLFICWAEGGSGRYFHLLFLLWRGSSFQP